MYDELITKVEKATSPTQTIVEKPESSDTIVEKPTDSSTIIEKPTTPTSTVVEEGTSPTQTIIEKPYNPYLLAEDLGILTAEDGTILQIEE